MPLCRTDEQCCVQLFACVCWFSVRFQESTDRCHALEHVVLVLCPLKRCIHSAQHSLLVVNELVRPCSELSQFRIKCRWLSDARDVDKRHSGSLPGQQLTLQVDHPLQVCVSQSFKIAHRLLLLLHRFLLLQGLLRQHLHLGNSVRNLFIRGPVRHFWTDSRVRWTRWYDDNARWLQAAAVWLTCKPHPLPPSHPDG